MKKFLVSKKTFSLFVSCFFSSLFYAEIQLTKTLLDRQDIIPPISIREGLNNILTQLNDVPAVMMSLVLLTADAKEKGLPYPECNLCKLVKRHAKKIHKPERATTFCDFHMGIDRINMPQFSGIPLAGGKADQLLQAGMLSLKENGEVDLESYFEEFLQTHGATISLINIGASELKSTQNELVGKKVANMWFILKQGVSHPSYNATVAPIFISEDRYVLDGHHRWAAQWATEFGAEKPLTFTMKVKKVNRTIDQLLQLSKLFIDEWGIQAKGT